MATVGGVLGGVQWDCGGYITCCRKRYGVCETEMVFVGNVYQNEEVNVFWCVS